MCGNTKIWARPASGVSQLATAGDLSGYSPTGHTHTASQIYCSDNVTVQAKLNTLTSGTPNWTFVKTETISATNSRSSLQSAAELSLLSTHNLVRIDISGNVQFTCPSTSKNYFAYVTITLNSNTQNCSTPYALESGAKYGSESSPNETSTVYISKTIYVKPGYFNGLLMIPTYSNNNFSSTSDSLFIGVMDSSTSGFAYSSVLVRSVAVNCSWYVA